MTYYSQDGYDIGCEWGIAGLTHISEQFDIAVIIDTLSFTTALDVALSRIVKVIPAPSDADLSEWSRIDGLTIARPRGDGPFSLSSATLEHLPEGTTLLLPSRNGAALSLKSKAKMTVAASLRNRAAVSDWLAKQKGRVLLCPAGEHWNDGSFRPAFEDWITAGAIASRLSASFSPETESAAAAFAQIRDVETALAGCSTGRELIGRGYDCDVHYAAAMDVSGIIPVLSSASEKSLGYNLHYAPLAT